MTAKNTRSVIALVDKYTSGVVWISFGYLAYCISAVARLRPKMSELDRAIKEKAELLQNLKGRN
ncbi:unnamed protein product [Eruca vesicaria subsp. sativa]|uniref:CcmD family protein n=1 Tax=Eruca vesicaria subsp. sativa TaxID=29727 RepID=A0ABC8KHB6_ERUVS|nr:unnamed protein product [Eruca vesicaria subsp. sativa]